MSGQDYIGKRIARWRDLAGMTQQELADRLGRTRNWVSMVENGHRPILRRDTLISVANALRVDVQQLIAQPSIRTKDELTVQRSIPALRAALYGPDEPPEPRPLVDVAADVDRLLAARMACDYAALAALMAPLVAETIALTARGRDGRQARELAVRSLFGASLAVKPMGYVDLALALAERAIAIAGDLDSPAELAASRYALSQAVLASGSRRRSLTLATTAARDVQAADAAWYGMLQLQAALAAASLGLAADAHLTEAKDAVEHRPGDSWHMEFTQANAGTWESAIALETGDYDAVPAIVNRVNRGELRTNQRRAHLLMNQGRGYYAAGDHQKAVLSILEADEIAPAEVRSRPSIREVVGQMARDAWRGSELAELTSRVRIDPLL